jgi:hypothetical protein
MPAINLLQVRGHICDELRIENSALGWDVLMLYLASQDTFAYRARLFSVPGEALPYYITASELGD